MLFSRCLWNIMRRRGASLNRLLIFSRRGLADRWVWAIASLESSTTGSVRYLVCSYSLHPRICVSFNRTEFLSWG